MGVRLEMVNTDEMMSALLTRAPQAARVLLNHSPVQTAIVALDDGGICPTQPRFIQLASITTSQSVNDDQFHLVAIRVWSSDCICDGTTLMLPQFSAFTPIVQPQSWDRAMAVAVCLGLVSRGRASGAPAHRQRVLSE